MKKFLTTIITLSLLLSVALSLIGCSKAVPQPQDEEIIPIKWYGAIPDEGGYYSMEYISGSNVFTYTDIETATEEIVKVDGVPQIFDVNNPDAKSPMYIYPIGDKLIYSYSDMEHYRLELVDKNSGESTVIYEDNDNIALGPVAYTNNASNELSSVYISTLLPDNGTQQLIRVGLDGEVTEIASLSTDMGVMGQDLPTHSIYSVNNVFYASISTTQGNEIRMIGENGEITELATLPGFEETSFSAFYSDGYYQLSTDQTLSRFNLATKEITELGKITSDYPIDYMTPIGGNLFVGYSYADNEMFTLTVDIDSMTADIIELSYTEKYATMPEYSLLISPFIMVGDNVVVVNGSSYATKLVTNHGMDREEIRGFMIEKTAVISRQNLKENNEVYTEIDRTELLSLVNTGDEE